MRWAGHIVRVGETRNASKFWLENLKWEITRKI